MFYVLNVKFNLIFIVKHNFNGLFILFIFCRHKFLVLVNLFYKLAKLVKPTANKKTNITISNSLYSFKVHDCPALRCRPRRWCPHSHQPYGSGTEHLFPDLFLLVHTEPAEECRMAQYWYWRCHCGRHLCLRTIRKRTCSGQSIGNDHVRSGILPVRHAVLELGKSTTLFSIIHILYWICIFPFSPKSFAQRASDHCPSRLSCPDSLCLAHGLCTAWLATTAKWRCKILCCSRSTLLSSHYLLFIPTRRRTSPRNRRRRITKQHLWSI